MREVSFGQDGSVSTEGFEARYNTELANEYGNLASRTLAMKGWYCPRCADFKTEQEIVDGNKCPIHHIELTWEKEDNYFFRLSSFQERLEQLYAERPDFVMPRERYNEAVGFIRQGLEDVSCTRARLRWGVKAPWDESQVFYVWFDALLNYYTALTYARPGEDLTERYWPADFHLIGKDILKFHAVIWPAMLMAAEVEVPRHLFIHGFLLMQGEKMSKSLGNVLDPFKVIDVFGTDALRYYCMREVSFGQDGSVSTEGFEARYNTELANEYGNLASRTLAMIARYRDGVVPAAQAPAALAGDFDGLADVVLRSLRPRGADRALEQIWSRGVRRLNRYVEEQAPWTLAKEGKDEQLDEVLYGLAEGLRVVSVLLHPTCPTPPRACWRRWARTITHRRRLRSACRFDGLADAACERFDRAELTAALEQIWSRGVRRLNRYVEEQRRGRSPRRARTSSSTRCSTGWPRACA